MRGNTVVDETSFFPTSLPKPFTTAPYNASCEAGGLTGCSGRSTCNLTDCSCKESVKGVTQSSVGWVWQYPSLVVHRLSLPCTSTWPQSPVRLRCAQV